MFPIRQLFEFYRHFATFAIPAARISASMHVKYQGVTQTERLSACALDLGNGALRGAHGFWRETRSPAITAVAESCSSLPEGRKEEAFTI